LGNQLTGGGPKEASREYPVGTKGKKGESSPKKTRNSKKSL